MSVQRILDFEELERKSVPELWTVDEIYQAINGNRFADFGEDQRLERKTGGSHAELLATYVCMWANTPPDGGLIAVGIEDDGVITGCKSITDQVVDVEKRIRFDLVSDASFDTKRVQATNAQGDPDYVLLYRVRYRDNKVIETNKSEAYIRWASSRHLLTHDEVRELQMERGQLSYELESCGLSWPDSFDMNAIKNWAAAIRLHKKMAGDPAIPQVLSHHRLGVIKNGGFVPNNACALLFARDTQEIVPGCMVRFQRIEGREAATGKERNVVQDIRIVGTIPQIIEQTGEVLATHLRTYRKLGKGGKFFTSPEYPEEAWHEAIVNACAHRSYSLKGANIFVKMFDDRLVIESPGGFPPLVTPANIYDVHHRRNWWLMDALFFLDYVQCENEGTKRIRRAMLDSELPEPEFEQKQISNALVRVTLRNNQSFRHEWIDADVASVIGSELAKSLSDVERRIINFAVEHDRQIKSTEAMNFLPLPRWGTADKLLMKLAKMGIFRKVSRYTRDPTAYYALIDPSSDSPPPQS